MTGMPLPWYGQVAENSADGMNHEGLAWFTDLTVPDPTMTFPLLIGAGTLLNVEVTRLIRIQLHIHTLLT